MDSTSLNQICRLMALCARVERHPRFDEQLGRQLRDFTAWEALPAQAELHGMGPLLWHHLQGADIPESTRRTLRGLYLRDRALNQIHTKTLLELLDLLGQGGIRPLVLKGLALAWQIYPDPALRPVSDIDLFLAKEELLPAVEIMRQAGYRFEGLPASSARLPKGLNADSLPRDGVSTHIELHHYDPAHRTINDNSPDDEFRDIREPPQRVIIDGCDVYTTSPLDTLHYLMRHLTRHLLYARADRPVSFKWMADITSLVEQQARDLDWKALLRRDPAFLKRLSVLYSLTPLPDGYETVLPLKKRVSMGGLGQYPRGWPQWPFPNWAQVGFWRYVRLTFAPPPEWWLRLVYGIDSGPVAWHGQVVYRLRLLQLMGWALARRLVLIWRCL
jgi:hypothetical protein